MHADFEIKVERYKCKLNTIKAASDLEISVPQSTTKNICLQYIFMCASTVLSIINFLESVFQQHTWQPPIM